MFLPFGHRFPTICSVHSTWILVKVLSLGDGAALLGFWTLEALEWKNAELPPPGGQGANNLGQFEVAVRTE